MEQVMCVDVVIPSGVNLYFDTELVPGKSITRFGATKMMYGSWEGGLLGWYTGTKVRYNPGNIRLGFGGLEIPSVETLNEAGERALRLIEADKVQGAMARISNVAERLQQEIRPLETSRLGLVLESDSLIAVETIVQEMIGKLGVLINQLRVSPAIIESDTAALIKRLWELEVVEVEMLGVGLGLTWPIQLIANELSF